MAEKYDKTFFKNKFFRIIFSKRIIFIILILLQLGAMFLIYNFLREKYTYYYWSIYALNILVTIYIINRKDNPVYKLAWIVPILMMPIFGPLLYLFVRFQIGTQLFRNNLYDAIENIENYMVQDYSVVERLREIDKQKANLANYTTNSGGYPMFQNTEIKYFRSGEEKLIALLSELNKAEEYIFLEYFIVERGIMWDSIQDILVKKAQEGVEVRFIYDGTNNMVKLPKNFKEYLEKRGIRTRVFNPIKPLLATYQNNRDHRKIVVIDGKVAFTGGVNLADEYINEKDLYGYWKDTAIMQKGDGVKNFTAMFLQMWNFLGKEKGDGKKYLGNHNDKFKDVEQRDELGFVLNYSDSPMDNESVGENVYLDIISKANDYVYITSPYLILDYELEAALVYAAKCGIDVRIVLPSVPDKKYVHLLARDHYRHLVESGVKIYEYTPGFIHAKMFLCDDIEAVVGTINLDFRSLYLHFECASYIYANPVIEDIKDDFEDIFTQSELITIDKINSFNVFASFIGKVLKVFAPLM